jgi:hypothetical protein
MDYAAKKRPELLALCQERGVHGISHKTKRELIGLLESADREAADLRRQRQRRLQQQADEEQQMKAAEVADLPLADHKQPPYKRTIAHHLIKAIMTGFPQCPLLTAAMFAATTSKNETIQPPLQKVTQAFTIYPLQALNEASYSQLKL